MGISRDCGVEVADIWAQLGARPCGRSPIRLRQADDDLNRHHEMGSQIEEVERLQDRS